MTDNSKIDSPDLTVPCKYIATTPTFFKGLRSFGGNIIAGIIASLLVPTVINIYKLAALALNLAMKNSSWPFIICLITLAVIVTLNTVITAKYTNDKLDIDRSAFILVQLSLGTIAVVLVVLALTVRFLANPLQ